MGKGRVEAFGDGVIAIIITIMVLELKVPDGYDLAALTVAGRVNLQNSSRQTEAVWPILAS
jgi:uncharacterized membrane protein